MHASGAVAQLLEGVGYALQHARDEELLPTQAGQTNELSSLLRPWTHAYLQVSEGLLPVSELARRMRFKMAAQPRES